MATILAYTSPALGHLLPISTLLLELAHRGHTVHVRTHSRGVEIGQRLGFTTDAIDPLIEGIEQDDWRATNPLAALKLSVAVFGRRAVHEVADLADAVKRVQPNALLVDVIAGVLCRRPRQVASPGQVFRRTRRRCERPGCHRLGWV
jgi:UDP:flavonoid glycosyltransferase YjiC (YdhE family)